MQALVFGGNDGKACTNECLLFDLEHMAWTPLACSGLCFFSPVFHGRFCNTHFGGTGGICAHPSGTAPTPRQGHTAVVIGHEMFVIGGFTGIDSEAAKGAMGAGARDGCSLFLDDVWALDLATLAWRCCVAPRSPIGRLAGEGE